MKVVARGWKRDCGASEVMAAELEDGYRRGLGPNQGYSPGVTYLRARVNGDVEIKTGPHSLTFGGKYQIVTTLSKADILVLFKEAYEEELAPLMPFLKSLIGAKTDDSDEAA